MTCPSVRPYLDGTGREFMRIAHRLQADIRQFWKSITALALLPRGAVSAARFGQFDLGAELDFVEDFVEPGVVDGAPLGAHRRA